MNVQVTERKFEHLSEEELLEQTFFHTCPRKAVIHFVTPAAFKSNGSYLNYPTIRRIFQSLLNKFNAVSSSSSLDMDLVLDDIEKNVIATGYRLKSTYFNLEGIKVPSFLGSLALFTKGPQQMVNLIYMLLQFGTYSGVGIKTAMGMGRNMCGREGYGKMENVTKVAIGGLLHDVGKLLYRNGDGRNHAESGYDFLKDQAQLKEEEILQQIRYHHAANNQNRSHTRRFLGLRYIYCR